MNYLLLPKQFVNSSDVTEAVNLATEADISLGGFFYDHISDAIGSVIGVRYYVDDEVIFRNHPVFNQFLEDRRFLFNQENSFVDVLFDGTYVELLKEGSLTINCVQDFGVDSIVKCGDLYGICFNLEQ